MIPVSTYGASKLAGEALISSYAAMFDLRGRVFRFGNVVGPRQTHGIGFDFVHKLRADPSSLTILGDGSQSKSYIHVQDVVDAVLLAYERTESPFAAYNVATGDYITVREIADLAIAMPRARLRLGAARVRRAAPRLEGRRPGRADRYAPHPLAGMGVPAGVPGRLARRDRVAPGRRRSRPVDGMTLTSDTGHPGEADTATLTAHGHRPPCDEGLRRRRRPRRDPRARADPLIKGFTTNPTLMRAAGVETTKRSRSTSSSWSPICPSRSRCSATTSTRWSGRRSRSRVGPERLRQGAHHRHARRDLGGVAAPARRSRHPDQRDRAHDAGAGRGRHRSSPAARRRSSPCSRAHCRHRS